MNAEIFYTREQEGKEQALRKLLQSRIYPGVAITSHLIHGLGDENLQTVHERHQLAARYIKLLQASIPPNKQVGVYLTEAISYGFYAYSNYHGRIISFQREGFEKLLPAVAIQDRMMIVPQDLSMQLTGREEYLSLFRPIEMGGVVESNFDDAYAVEEAITKVGHKLRADIIQDFRAYASYRQREEINFSELAQNLGVNWRFVKEILQSRVKEASFYSQLSCHLGSQSLPLKRWTKVDLTITNDSDVGLSGLIISVSGPVQVLPMRLYSDVTAHSKTQITIAIRPDEPGDFPLEITLSLPEDQIFSEWMPVHHLWLQVAE